MRYRPLAVAVLATWLLAAPLAAQTSTAAAQADDKSSASAAGQTEPKATEQPPPRPVPGWARVSFFANASTSSGSDGTSSNFSEVITSLAAQAPRTETAGVTYGLDMRFAGYPSTQARTNRWSIYNAWAGLQSGGRKYSLKAGQIWLDDLGALGSLGGAVVETRLITGNRTGELRVGGFGGLEPEILQAGYVNGIRKFGAYVAYEATGKPQRHVVGYVNIRDAGLTERSVFTFSNFLPLGKDAFVYQAAEYDLAGPAGLGKGGLSYFFTNARTKVAQIVEVQGTYHRGRSIDARGITIDQLNGRPVDAKSLDGFRYESIGGRVTVQVVKGMRVFGGYAIDRNNRGDPQAARAQFGVWTTNLLGTGLDVNVSDYRTIQSGVTSYDSWYVSAGRRILAQTYLTGEFSSSLAVLRFLGSQNFTILARPRTRRYAVSSTVNATRRATMLLTVERVDDALVSQTRLLTGLTYRF